MWKALSVRLRTPLPSKWIQFQSCARCTMHTLKQASIPPHPHKHAQFLSLPTAISFLAYYSHFFSLLFAHFCAFFLLSQAGSGEWRYISDRVTRSNDLQRDKKAFTTQPWQTGWQDGRRETRRGGIFTSVLLSLPAGSILALALLRLCVMTWQRGRHCFFNFHLPLEFLFYLFLSKLYLYDFTFLSSFLFSHLFLLPLILHRCVLAFLSNYSSLR